MAKESVVISKIKFTLFNSFGSVIERFSFECRKTKTKTMIGFGWVGGASFLNQSQNERSKAKPILDYFRYSMENRSY